MKFDKKYYDDIWGHIGGVHRHDYTESLANRLIAQYGKVRILDAGTGCGHLVKLLREKGADAWGFDVSDYAIENCCAPGYVVKAHASKLPFADNSFDVVHSNGLFGYDEDVASIWKELNRVGKIQDHNIDTEECDLPPEFQITVIKPRAWWDKQLQPVFNEQYYRDIWGTYTDENGNPASGLHRHDYCADLADKLIQQFGKVRILDIGSACGFLVKTLREKGADAYGLEISDYALENSCVPGYVIKGDVRDLPFKDNEFDLVMSQGLWEYIPEDEVDKAFSECKRAGKHQWHYFDPAERENYPEHKKVTVKPREWWDEKKIGIDFPITPKVLVTCPTYEGKEYCFKEWIDMAKNLTYPNYDVLVVDNSKTEDFYNRWKDKIPMKHMTFRSDEKDDNMYRVCKSMAEVQRQFLKGDYTHWMNIEADVIPPPDVIEKLMKYGQDADWVAHVYPASPTKTWMAGIGCSLLSRKLMTDFDWDDTTIADDSPDSELWGWVQSHGGYKTVELYYVCDVKHLK